LILLMVSVHHVRETMVEQKSSYCSGQEAGVGGGRERERTVLLGFLILPLILSGSPTY
jgi:hypothetical protein